MENDQNEMKNVLEIFFSLSKPKVVYVHFYLMYHFPKFVEQDFMYFVPRPMETGINYLHELTTFLKYHVRLMSNQCMKQKTLS